MSQRKHQDLAKRSEAIIKSTRKELETRNELSSKAKASKKAMTKSIGDAQSRVVRLEEIFREMTNLIDKQKINISKTAKDYKALRTELLSVDNQQSSSISKELLNRLEEMDNRIETNYKIVDRIVTQLQKEREINLKCTSSFEEIRKCVETSWDDFFAESDQKYRELTNNEVINPCKKRKYTKEDIFSYPIYIKRTEDSNGMSTIRNPAELRTTIFRKYDNMTDSMVEKSKRGPKSSAT